MQASPLPELPHVVRGACLLAASVAGIGTLAVVLTIWHQQADPLWLAATPEVLAEVAACDQTPDRSRRTKCKRALVLARAQPVPAVVVASR